MSAEWKELLDLFKSYRWPTIWSQAETGEGPFVSFLASVIRVIWWEDNELGRRLLAEQNSYIPAQDQHFFKALLALSINNKDAYSTQKRHLNKQGWRHDWLKIEELGRSANYKAQARLFKKLTNKYSSHDFLYVALLQSIERISAKTFPLEKLFDELPESDLKQVLFLRLNRSNLTALSEMQFEDDHYFNVAQYTLTRRLDYKTVSVQDRLKLHDNVARTKFIDIGILKSWLQIAISCAYGQRDFISRTKYSRSICPAVLDQYLDISIYEMIYYWITDRAKEAFEIFKDLDHYEAQGLEVGDSNLKIFRWYILRLFIFRQGNASHYPKNKDPNIHVIGESHSLALNNYNFTKDGKEYLFVSRFIMGVKMYHLGMAPNNPWKQSFSSYISSIPADKTIMLTIGEIDCRADEGIFTSAKKLDQPVDDVAKKTVEDYFKFIEGEISQFKNVLIQGIPFPKYDRDVLRSEDLIEHSAMLCNVNNYIEQETQKRGWTFVDVYNVSKDGEYHLDPYHLMPKIYEDPRINLGM